MIIVRIGALAFFLLIMSGQAVEIWTAAQHPGGAHSLFTANHVWMSALALLALGLMSERVSDRLLKYLQAVRGIRPKTDEHPKPKPRRRKP